MKLIFTTLILITFTCCTVTAQWAVDDPKDVELVKNSTLAVVAVEKDGRVVKKLGKKPEELKEYEEGISYFNTTLKEVIGKDWKYSKAVKFISEAEAQKLEEEKNTSHCILRLIELSNYKLGDFYSTDPNLGFNKLRDLHYHMSLTGKLSALSIQPASNSKKTIVSAHLPAFGISYASIKFMLQYMQHQMDDCEKKGITKYGKMKDDIETRNAEVKNKTLLLFDPLISKNLQKSIDDKSLAKNYPYKVEVGDISKLNTIVGENNNNYAYILTIPSGSEMNGVTMHQYCVVNAGDGRILFLSDKSIAGAIGQFHEYHLKALSKSLK